MSGRLINSLREERLERRLSQQALADLAGISRQSYAAIESGASVPSTGVALRLARALGFPSRPSSGSRRGGRARFWPIRSRRGGAAGPAPSGW